MLLVWKTSSIFCLQTARALRREGWRKTKNAYERSERILLKPPPSRDQRAQRANPIGRMILRMTWEDLTHERSERNFAAMINYLSYNWISKFSIAKKAAKISRKFYFWRFSLRTLKMHNYQALFDYVQNLSGKTLSADDKQVFITHFKPKKIRKRQYFYRKGMYVNILDSL